MTHDDNTPGGQPGAGEKRAEFSAGAQATTADHMAGQHAGAVPPDRMVDFGAAVELFFKNYLNFQGRSSRGAYWYWVLASFLISIVLGIVDALLFGTGPGSVDPLGSIFGLATLIPAIALSVRRLHDIGKSGWWQLIALTIIGIAVLIYWACQPGNRGTNVYGPDREAGR